MLALLRGISRSEFVLPQRGGSRERELDPAEGAKHYSTVGTRRVTVSSGQFFVARAPGVRTRRVGSLPASHPPSRVR